MRTSHQLALAISAALAIATSAQAGELSGTLDSQITLLDGCAISGAIGGPSTGASFGVMNFGLDASTFVGTKVSTASGSAGGAGPTQIVCSPDVAALTITVDGGQHPGEGAAIGDGPRAMSLGGNSFVPYEVYSDSGMTVPYPIATPQSVTTPTGAPSDLPIYGRVNKTSPAALPSGVYTDQLQVTLTW